MCCGRVRKVCEVLTQLNRLADCAERSIATNTAEQTVGFVRGSAVDGSKPIFPGGRAAEAAATGARPGGAAARWQRGSLQCPAGGHGAISQRHVADLQ